MARTTYVLRGGELVEKVQALPLHLGGDAPMVIADTMDPVRNMADGRVYDSKRAYYHAVRAAGCEIVGNERAPFERRPEYEPAVSGHDIKRAIEQLVAR